MRIVLVSKGFELALHNVFGSCTLNLCPPSLFLIGKYSFHCYSALKTFVTTLIGVHRMKPQGKVVRDRKVRGG